MKIKINDWFGIHKGYNLTIQPGYTALVGPNGAGKSTLLHQIREFASKEGIQVFNYNNLFDGGHNAIQKHHDEGNMKMMAELATSSEGEQVSINFGQAVKAIGNGVRKHIQDKTPFFILLDSLDSGASIDRDREVRSLFNMIHQDIKDNPIYLVASVNAYELAKDADCVDVRTGKHIKFNSYEQYADFICEYFNTHQRYVND